MLTRFYAPNLEMEGSNYGASLVLRLQALIALVVAANGHDHELDTKNALVLRYKALQDTIARASESHPSLKMALAKCMGCRRN